MVVARIEYKNPTRPSKTGQEWCVSELHIDRWEPDITRTIPVRPGGKISLPLLNDVQAAELSTTQLSSNIGGGLTKYLSNPQVTVTVTQINTRRMFLTGEVVKSGAMPLIPGMTALQALSASGGFTQFAKEKGDLYSS